MEIELIKSENLVDDIWEFQFTKPTALIFDAGDYVELGLGDAGRRWLSIASSPTDNELTFITKISELRSDFKQAFIELKPRQVATISPAIGSFNLPPTDKLSLLWVAGGIGITPYLSMIRWLANQSERNLEIELIYAAKPGQHIYLDEVNSAVNAVYQLEERPTLEDLQPLITTDNIIYLSGPQPLCEQLYAQLLDTGVERSRIKLDYFEGYEEL